MAKTLGSNEAFCALLRREDGATGRQLADLTGRRRSYSTCDLRCVETDAEGIWVLRDGVPETRYFLKPYDWMPS